MDLFINPLCAECLWCMTFANIFLEIIQKLMRTTHVRQENRAFVPVLLSVSRCDSGVLSPNGFFFNYHSKLIRFQIRKQTNTKNFHLFFFIFSNNLKLPVGGRTVTAESTHS